MKLAQNVALLNNLNRPGRNCTTTVFYTTSKICFDSIFREENTREKLDGGPFDPGFFFKKSFYTFQTKMFGTETSRNCNELKFASVKKMKVKPKRRRDG